MDFATKRGLVLGCEEAPKEVDNGGTLSPTLDVEIEPGAFGTENLVNETGLNDVGFLTEPVRV